MNLFLMCDRWLTVTSCPVSAASLFKPNHCLCLSEEETTWVLRNHSREIRNSFLLGFFIVFIFSWLSQRGVRALRAFFSVLCTEIKQPSLVLTLSYLKHLWLRTNFWPTFWSEEVRGWGAALRLRRGELSQMFSHCQPFSQPTWTTTTLWSVWTCDPAGHRKMFTHPLFFFFFFFSGLNTAERMTMFVWSNIRSASLLVWPGCGPYPGY